MTRQSFLQGTLIIVIATLTTEILRMVMNVVINRELGAEGFGLFLSVTPLLWMALTLASMALPVAISKVVSEAIALGDLEKVRRAMRFSTITVTVLSVSISFLLFLMAPILTAKWLEPGAYLPILTMAAWIPISCISSVLRGYYMGIQNQYPPSLAWIIETVCRTAFTIPLIYWAMPYGLPYAAMAVMAGMGIGELGGLLFMYWRFHTKDRFLTNLAPLTGQAENSKQTINALAEIAVPSTLSNILGTVIYALEPIVLYMAFANVGVAKTQATSLYGSIGMALQLIVFPMVFHSALSTVLVPAVSEAVALNHIHVIRHRLNQTIWLTLLLGLPATVLFCLFGQDLSVALYHDRMAGSLLSFIAPICIYMFLRDPLSSILQGMNKAGLSTVIALFASAVKLLLIFYYVNRPGFGIYGVADAIAVSVIFNTVVYFYFVIRLVGFNADWIETVKMFTATALFGIIVYQIKIAFPHTSPSTRVIHALLFGGLFYFAALVILKVIRAEALERIPVVGPKLATVLRFVPFLT